VAEVASELAECLEVLAEELSFELALDPGAGVPAVLVAGSIDRIDRLPLGRHRGRRLHDRPASLQAQ